MMECNGRLNWWNSIPLNIQKKTKMSIKLKKEHLYLLIKGYEPKWLTRLLNSFKKRKLIDTYTMNIIIVTTKKIEEIKLSKSVDGYAIDLLHASVNDWKEWDFKDWVNVKFNGVPSKHLYISMDSNDEIDTEKFTNHMLKNITNVVETNKVHHVIYPLKSFNDISTERMWMVDSLVFTYYYIYALQYIVCRLTGLFYYMSLYWVNTRDPIDVNRSNPDFAFYHVYRKTSKIFDLKKQRKKTWCNVWIVYYVIRWIMWLPLMIIPGTSFLMTLPSKPKETYLIVGNRKEPPIKFKLIVLIVVVYFYSASFYLLPQIYIGRPIVFWCILVLHMVCCYLPIYKFSKSLSKYRTLFQLTKMVMSKTILAFMTIFFMWILAPLFVAFYYSYRKYFRKSSIVRRFELSILLV